MRKKKRFSGFINELSAEPIAQTMFWVLNILYLLKFKPLDLLEGYRISKCEEAL